ncbi:MAG TPA: hypothetical protein ENF81_04040 [Thermotogaceae bacterium]|nr:hypothetical protein [Thermotogaceae bacterium]
MKIENISIKWTKWSIEHISRHNVQPEEVDICLFDNEPIVFKASKKSKDRYVVLCQCPHGRYLMIVISIPDSQGNVKVITARDMVNRERKYYLSKRR